ncbi:alpha-L-rhamnosidase-related protein [Thalassobellus sediminis]|uniref:alpha-L-rhamnosidase-related protein n=1 Tax=Thalassobellus sediminis TaxID=3367753 RepID=UPI0037A6B74C
MAKLTALVFRVFIGILFLSSISLFAQEVKEEATWIWFPGDLEIWVSNKMQSNRTERQAFLPPLWRYYSPYALVTFRKSVYFETDDEITINSEGQTKILIDGALHFGDRNNMFIQKNNKLLIPKGQHTITVKIYNQEKVPALFINGKYLKTNNSWKVTYEDKEWINASGKRSDDRGTEWQKAANWNFNSVSSLPSEFKLATTPKKPITTEMYKDGFVVDFGVETFGFVKLHGLKGKGSINLYYGESIEEAKSDYDCETLNRLTFDGTQEDEYTLEGSNAFRYIYVVPEGEISLDSVSMLYEYLPLDYKGAFKSSDEKLNKIWDISAYTMHLTSREFFIDGIKRDRWIWSGDAYQSYLMNYYLFNDNPSVKRTLFALRGKDPVKSHINIIMDYSFYWFLGVYDYYKFSGDEAFIKQIYPRMKSLMQFCLDRRNENGMVEGLPGDWLFIDWADGLTKDGEVSFEQLLLARSLEAMAICAKITGDNESIETYKNLAHDLKEKLFKIFWSEKKQAFIHNRVDNKLTDNVTRYTNMFAIFFDYLTETQKQHVKQNVLLNDNIQKITTPYMRFYELEALCALGEQEFVLDEIRDYWGGMLDLGATSFWELYDTTDTGEEHLAMYGRPYGKSLCHAWGASPIYLFGKYYLGVQPTSAGYKTYEVKPNLGGLKWIEGKVPTPNGEVDIYCSTKEIKVKASDGEGTLIFNSKSKPKTNTGVITQLDKEKYKLILQPNTPYQIKYKAH